MLTTSLPLAKNSKIFRRAALCMLAGSAVVVGTTCSSESEVRTGFLVSVQNHTAGAPAPDYLRFSWLTEQGFLFTEIRVPEKGILKPKSPNELATVVVDTHLLVAGKRRLIVHGMRGAEIESEGAVADLLAEKGARKQINVKLVLAGGLLDLDMDQIPDAVDNCPGTANPDQKVCVMTDAGVPDGGMMTAKDAGAFDAPPPVDMRPPAPDVLPMDVLVKTDLPMGNLVRNPGFEDGTMFWESVIGNATAAPPGRTDSAALKVVGANSFWRQQITPFYADATYRLEVWGRSSGTKCVAGVTIWTNSGTRRSVLIGMGTSFVRRELTSFLVPANATSIDVFVDNGTDAECFVDDFNLTVMKP